MSNDVLVVEILEKVALDPTSQHFFSIRESSSFTHVRLNIYPDGGVARFRVYGTVSVQWPQDLATLIDLAYLGHGSKVVACSNQHYARADNLLLPGRGIDMSDGWETRRSREINHSDWVIVKLGVSGFLDHAEIDTAFYKGNFPESALLEACYSDLEIPNENSTWVTVLERSKLSAHKQHLFQLSYGGLKRLQIFGRRQLPSSTSLQSPSIISQTSPEIVLTAEPLTYESFAPYGHVIASFKEPSVSPFMTSITCNLRITFANQGTARNIITLHRLSILGKLTLYQKMIRVFTDETPNSSKVFGKTSLFKSAFIPMYSGSNGKEYLVVVCFTSL
ncbi:15722_t:CDS:2 [Gigaspora rosea]|nr:15722_t:CDS:2 [Gigaspora rosea]